MLERYSLGTVVGDIYETSCRPDHWPVALERIAAYTHSNSAIYINRDNELDHVNSLYYYNIPKASIDEYNEYGQDPNFALMAENVPTGVAAAIDHLVPDRKALERIYGERFTRIITMSDRPYVGGVIVFMDEVRTAAIAVQRKRSSGIWTREEIGRLDCLVPHLRRSITIQKEFTRLQIREQVLKKGLDRFMMGLILFDKDVQPIYINPVAESILNYHPAIRLRGNNVVAHSHEDTDRIHKALRGIVSGVGADESSIRSTAMGIRHPDCETILPVIISPVGDMFRGFEVDGNFAYAVMCFSDPDRYMPIDADLLADIYGLTPAETQVAISLANGLRPEGIAEMKDVTLSTIRSQIKAIYKKMDVNQQAELVKLLLTGPFIGSLKQKRY